MPGNPHLPQGYAWTGELISTFYGRHPNYWHPCWPPPASQQLAVHGTSVPYSGTVTLLPPEYNACVGGLPAGYALAIVAQPGLAQQQPPPAQQPSPTAHGASRNLSAAAVTPAATNRQASAAATSTDHEPKRARYDDAQAIDLTGGSDSDGEDANAISASAAAAASRWSAPLLTGGSDSDGKDANASDDDVSDASETRYDWDDPCWDHHFGKDHPSAGCPYGNRGRTDGVWKVLEHYGFEKADPAKKKGKGEKVQYFEGKTPSPCFEKLVRSMFKKGVSDPECVNLDAGEIRGYSIAHIAGLVRSSHHMGYLEDDDRKKVSDMSDKDLVRDALSDDGLEIGHYHYYYSFCWNGLEQGECTWHCRICGDCKDWRDWHCKGCNTCRYGVSIPCSECNPKQYKKYLDCYG